MTQVVNVAIVMKRQEEGCVLKVPRIRHQDTLSKNPKTLVFGPHRSMKDTPLLQVTSYHSGVNVSP
jgi:hypothetical protein